VDEENGAGDLKIGGGIIKMHLLNIICELVDWFYPTQASYH